MQRNKVFIPNFKCANPFLDEILVHSRHYFHFDNFKNYNNCCDVVLINWPEQIFGWNEPSIEELDELEECINIWMKCSKIIYVAHNLKPHSGMSKRFERLYNLIEKNCSAMIHFGKYSCNLYQNKFPDILHQVIKHPLYIESYGQYDKLNSRDQLGIDREAKVITVLGKIRNMDERRLVVKGFNALKEENKVLIVTRMMRIKFPWNFKGKYRLRHLINVDLIYDRIVSSLKFRKPKYKFNHEFLDSKKISLMISAADIILIPRIKILNSGNVFLALTFRKIFVGPRKGNIKEVSDSFGFPSFDPYVTESVMKALQKGLDMSKSNDKVFENKLVGYLPKSVAADWDDFIVKVLD